MTGFKFNLNNRIAAAFGLTKFNRNRIVTVISKGCRPIQTLSLLVLVACISIHPVKGDDMQMDEKGMIMNANTDRLPKDCQKIAKEVNFTIHAGHQHALQFPGKMFAFDHQQWDVPPCAKVNITFINDDDIRHQLMIHGLPSYLYPQGMFHLELYGKGQLQAALIVPSMKKTYLVHCELPQHMEKGMKGQLKVDGGDGDLPSIPGLTKPIRADSYSVDWSILSFAVGVLSMLVGFALVYVLLKKFLGVNG